MPLDLKALSKVLAHALRHQPWLYELELDEEGWTSVEAVLTALRKERREWAGLTEDDLVLMIQTSAKRRYEMGGGRIRALYGHSISGKLRKFPAVPPDVLFHGTNPEVVSEIQVSGLLPMLRQYVHLSVDQATALEVGRRKARKPVVLRVLARLAHENGLRFYEGNEKVWLADEVPPKFITFDG
jgi:putative RNA 2'-phosphotransferase